VYDFSNSNLVDIVFILNKKLGIVGGMYISAIAFIVVQGGSLELPNFDLSCLDFPFLDCFILIEGF